MKFSPALRAILIIHAIITFAAGVVLIIRPELIPQTVGIDLDQHANLLSYFLGAAEITIAFLSFAASKITDAAAVQLILWAFVIFHALTALVELLALTQGVNGLLLGNVAIRIIAAGLFAYYAFRK